MAAVSIFNVNLYNKMACFHLLLFSLDPVNFQSASTAIKTTYLMLGEKIKLKLYFAMCWYILYEDH